jgi:subfamily B ATP-binding cassette protein MsbA
MVVTFIIKGVLQYTRGIYFAWLQQRVMLKARLDLITRFGNIGYEGYTKLDAGRINMTLTGDIGNMVYAMTTYFSVFQDAIMVITYFALAFWANWQFSIIVIVGAYLTNLIYNYVNRVTKELGDKNKYLGFNFGGDLIQIVNNFKYLKATDNFKTMYNKLRNNIIESQSNSWQMAKLSAIVGSVREPLMIAIIAGVILLEVNVFGQPFGSMIAGLLMFYRSLGSIIRMQTSWNSFIAATPSIDAVNEIVAQFNQHSEPYFEERINNIDNIEVKNLKIQFGEKVVLKNINLLIKDRNSVAFVGESGAGKTTLANVICGLQYPHGGNIFTEGKNIYETDLKFYRRRVGYITQEPVIFNETIFNNISFWEEKTPESIEKLYKVLEMVQLKDFVENLKDKEDTKLGHNGILVSGGQKQRISIARELFRNDVDLLIMDEATSALDSETEHHIKESIDMLQGKFTMIIIAHRLSTIKNVDMIYLMEDGVITNYGNFNELINKSPKFKRMVEMQEL